MAPKLKVQPAELLGFSFPEAVQVQSSLRQENNPASMSLLAMCYILVNERCLVENQPKAVCSSAVCCFLQTYLYFWVSLQQLFSVILDCIGVWGDKVISTLCCLSKVKVLHKELGPVGAFKKKKKSAVRFGEFTVELCWTDPEGGSCYPTCVLCPKRDFGDLPCCLQRGLSLFCVPQGESSKQQEKEIIPIYSCQKTFSLFYYKWALWRK